MPGRVMWEAQGLVGRQRERGENMAQKLDCGFYEKEWARWGRKLEQV